MDYLFKFFTPRKVFLFIVLLAAASLARRYGHDLRDFYLARRYPPVGGPSPAGRDISRKWDEAESRHVVSEYQRVCASLAAARAQGFKVDGLKAEADAALALNTPAYRRQALQILSKVEFSIPRKR